MTSDTTIPVEGHLYDATLHFTSLDDFGVSLQALNSGQVAPPPAGARIDIGVAGTLTGERLHGTLRGTDYITVRADGRFQLHIHAALTTDDDARIDFDAEGIAVPGANGIVQFRKGVTLTTAHPTYSWVNGLQIWSTGHADMTTGTLHWQAYIA